MSEPVVVKVGGSLLAWPELRARLTAWLNTLAMPNVVLVPGGGATAEVVRELDRVHVLGDEAAHWLAIQAMGLNAHVLAALLPRARVVSQLAELPAAWSCGDIPVLDCLALLREEDALPGALPHTWAVTSDSIAGWVAERVGARRLVLLKSVAVPVGLDWREAARRGLVDERFAEVVERARLEVASINLRQDTN